eukprot:6886476-Prymnesium_polylepis.1
MIAGPPRSQMPVEKFLGDFAAGGVRLHLVLGILAGILARCLRRLALRLRVRLLLLCQLHQIAGEIRKVAVAVVQHLLLDLGEQLAVGGRALRAALVKALAERP